MRRVCVHACTDDMPAPSFARSCRSVPWSRARVHIRAPERWHAFGGLRTPLNIVWHHSGPPARSGVMPRFTLPYAILMKRWVHTMSNTTQTLRIARTYLCHTGSTKARRNVNSVIATHRSGPPARSGVTPSFTQCYLMRRSVPTMSHTTHTQRNARTYSCHYGSTKARRNAHSVIAGIVAVHQRAAA